MPITQCSTYTNMSTIPPARCQGMNHRVAATANQAQTRQNFSNHQKFNFSKAKIKNFG